MTHKIKKILIANRGEIACRVIKTARKMGIKTVAVYSDADAKALHVRMADQAVHIGASPAAESYLVIDKIIAACRETGADSVHPGYGFLSENPAFARRLKKEKITFIGPAAESMEAMGLKDAAKALMTTAGVPVTPGYQGDNQDPKHLAKEAGKIGYPVLIKAVAGGGGKGMRKVEKAENFEDMLASCQREAKSSFGNDIVLIEKYITSPRHIEVQVFGDTHGNVVHMFERDCSLQRRHQKVIEEAPAPGMTEAVRAAMTTAAVNAAKAVDYVGAGTVEFIVDGSGELKEDGFWFMEMNTRLQVEHPVTEMITGLDLVELQIRVAQGEKLPKQKDIKMEGHAVEARLYAEDPANDFLPSIGKLEILGGLNSDPHVRIDTGVEEGDAVSIFYDPMIAKVITCKKNRTLALGSLKIALEGVRVWPVVTNARFLRNLCDLKEVFDTNFIGKNIQSLTKKPLSPAQGLGLAAIFEDFKPKCFRSHNKVKPTVFDDGSNWRVNLPSNNKHYFMVDDDIVEVSLKKDGNNSETTTAAGGSVFRRIKILPERRPGMAFCVFKSETDSLMHATAYYKYESLVYFCEGACLEYRYEDYSLDSTSNANALTAPMPGKIISVEAKVGDAVKAGDKLIVMEAMKMEMSLEAPRDGVVANVSVKADQLVNDGDILLELEKEDD